MDDPIWRQAIRDEQHSLHRAAWQLFSPSFNVHYSAETLASQKDEVVNFIYLILDESELYNEDSLGKGNAPINAVELLGEWRVVEAIPRLVQILETEDWETIVHDRAILALEKMGRAAVEPLLELAARTTDPQDRVTVASILSRAGKGDLRAQEYIRALFDEQHNQHDILYMAENVLVYDPAAGIAFLEERLRQQRFDRKVRAKLEGYLKDARNGVFDDL